MISTITLLPNPIHLSPTTITRAATLKYHIDEINEYFYYSMYYWIE